VYIHHVTVTPLVLYVNQPINQSYFLTCPIATNSYFDDHIEGKQLRDKTIRRVWERRSKCIFNRCLNVSRDGKEIMCEGKSFHIHAPVTEKARRPTVESLDGRNKQTVGGRGPKS